jgi:hypothetical protein
VAKRIGKALLNRLECGIAVARNCPRDTLELTELRSIERLDPRPHARLVHLQSMILPSGRFVYSGEGLAERSQVA